MIGVALKGLLSRKLRSTLTAFAIVLGVAMISGSFVLTDTLGKTFDGIYDESYQATDAVISSEEAVNTGDDTPEAPAFAAEVLSKIERLPGVRRAQGSIEDQARLVDKRGKPIGKAGNSTAVGVDSSADQTLNPVKLVRASGRAARARSRSTKRPRKSSTSRSARRSARSRTARFGTTGSAGSSGSGRSTRSAARRSSSSICRPPSGCSTSWAGST